MITKLAALVAASFTVVGCASTRPLPPRPTAGARPPEEQHVYRLDLVLASNEPGQPPATSKVTFNLEEHSQGEVHMGTNVALPTSVRVDVGLKIRASVFPVGGELLLRDSVEMSAIDEHAAIHKVTTTGEALLQGSTPALVASLEDPLSHKQYQVTATATLLR